MEQDAEGHVQYVHKRSLASDMLQLYAQPGGEVLCAPRGELCVKFCAAAPLRALGWLVEARCPTAGSGSATAGAPAPTSFASALRATSEGLARCLAPALAGELLSEGSAWESCVSSALLQADGQFAQRVCGQLEARFEPIAFSHRRRCQRNLHYRFEVLPLGAKRCCCY